MYAIHTAYRMHIIIYINIIQQAVILYSRVYHQTHVFIIQEFIYNVSKYVGLKKSLTLEKIHKVHDMLFCQVCMNFKLPVF